MRFDNRHGGTRRVSSTIVYIIINTYYNVKQYIHITHITLLVLYRYDIVISITVIGAAIFE